MQTQKFSVLYFPKEIALDFSVTQVINCIVENIKISDIEEMYLFDSSSEDYYLVSDFSNYTSLKDIIKPTFENGSLSMFDFDIQLKNGISIYTHENITVEGRDLDSLFKYVDYIFRFFHLDATKCKEIIISKPDEVIEFDVN